MYIEKDSWGVCWRFEGRPGWRMVLRSAGASLVDDGPLNRRGLRLLVEFYGLSNFANLEPENLKIVPPEVLVAIGAKATAA